MAVEGLDQGYRAFEQRHDDRGVCVEGKRPRRARRLERTRSAFNVTSAITTMSSSISLFA
jgi:hypothetical protein